MATFTRLEIAESLGISETRVRQILNAVSQRYPQAVANGRVTEFGYAQIERYRAIGKTAWDSETVAPTAPEVEAQPTAQVEAQPTAQVEAQTAPKQYTLVPVSKHPMAPAAPAYQSAIELPKLSDQIAAAYGQQTAWVDTAQRLTGLATVCLDQAATILTETRAASNEATDRMQDEVQRARLQVVVLKTQADLTQETLVANAVRQNDAAALGKSLAQQAETVYQSLGFRAVEQP